MTTISETVTPEHIMQVGLGFWGSKTLLSAVELELFTELAKQPGTVEDLQGRLGLHDRSARDVLDALVALGFLERNDGVYRNTPSTATFLDRRKPSYLGGMLEMANDRLFRFWSDLTEALRTWICRTCAYAAALAVVMPVAPGATAAGQEFAGRGKLRAHSNEFRKEVIRVTDGVHVAVGYSASNVILIQGDNGSIIVDTATDPVDAREVRAAFGNLLVAPVRAIIYTHGHPDHTGGAAVFAGNDNPDVYSHQLLVEGAPDIVRGMRDGGDQFGMTLPDSLFINAGIQLQYGRVTPPTREGYVPPTRTFSGDQLSLTIAGVRLQLLHTPGETRENIAVWLPDKRVLMPGDDFYRAFPNLYPIRGVRLRPPEAWIASLEKMIDLGAEHLVPGHTRPVMGADNVRAALTAYRDGIKFILDQTIEGIRRGERPDELVQRVKLPPHLADNPYLQEYYGSVAWSVRAIYSDYVGWFDGIATNLFPLPEKDRAARIIGMSGGAAPVLSRARDALAAGEFQWAAELADYVLAVNSENVEAKRLKAQALTELGERQINATARNYYLSSAQYLLRDLPPQ